ncbi:MAG TPA: DUF6352 family protein [Geminicoccaceae bacterium]|nr:DUF6352 family protein [Geminicoccaceae bacterium]
MTSGSRTADFWRSSGWHLVLRDARGRHLVTDALLRAYLARPELRPTAESCEAERALHAMLLERPERPVTPVHLVALADPDARENWQVFTAFRDRLLGWPTIEDAYLATIGGGAPALPPLFLDQLTHLILRGVLDGCGDGLRLRAGECLFRRQRVRVEPGTVLLADDETVQARAAAPGAAVELDLLREENAATYFARSDRFDMALDVSFTRPGLDALCRVLEAWLRHFLGVEVTIQPVRAVRDERWAWHTGLDAAASAILDQLYLGQDPGEQRLADILALFRLEFRDPKVVRAELAGRPVYLGMARDAEGRLRLKPQNLLLNLPLRPEPSLQAPSPSGRARARR